MGDWGRDGLLVVADGVLDTHLAAWLASDLLQRAKGRSPEHWRAVAARAATVARWSGDGRALITIPSITIDLLCAGQDLRAIGRLTAVQTVVLVRLLLGDSNKAIADCLGAGPKTVEGHVEAVLHALDVESRSQLWCLVYRRQIERALADAG